MGNASGVTLWKGGAIVATTIYFLVALRPLNDRYERVL